MLPIFGFAQMGGEGGGLQDSPFGQCPNRGDINFNGPSLSATYILSWASSVKIHNVGKKSLDIAAAPVYRHKSSHCKVSFYWCDTSSLSFLLVEKIRHRVSIYPVKATVCHPLLPVSPILILNSRSNREVLRADWKLKGGKKIACRLDAIARKAVGQTIHNGQNVQKIKGNRADKKEICFLAFLWPARGPAIGCLNMK